jgi:hypothetical protein
MAAAATTTIPNHHRHRNSTNRTFRYDSTNCPPHLRNSFVVRLNHPDTNATQTIDIYITTMHVLRALLW